MKKQKLSIVTPCFNESDNVIPLSKEISKILRGLPYEYEHIFIDNCSTDGTIDKLRLLAAKDKNIKVIINSRNFGPETSPYYGILQSTGDATIMLPSDFQEPPNLILDFVEKWKEGFNIVLSVRKKTESNKIIEVFRKAYYRFLNKISNVNLINDASGFGLYDKKVISFLKTLDDPMPYFRGLLCEIGFPIARVVFTQKPRMHGKSSHNIFSMIDAGLLGIIKHSKLPLRLFTLLGFISSLISFVAAFFYFLIKLLYWNSFEFGIGPLIIGFFFISGVQLFGLGLIGEYLSITLMYTRKFPLVVESERINF